MNKFCSILLALALFPIPCIALDWKIDMPFENTIFPSVVIAMRGFVDDEDKKNTRIGDAMGMIGASIKSPADNYPVKVTIEETEFFKKSSITATLPKKGVTYSVMPIIRYGVTSLIRQKQKSFDSAHIIVVTPDGEFEDTKRFEIRSINDCVLGLKQDGKFINTRFLFAAYVNENNPALDHILGYALKKGYVDSFIGYQGTRGDVVKQAGAIYRALQDMGFKYSSITGASGNTKDIYSQHVRFVGESLNTSQANCVDGTVILASLFMKIGLNPVIVTIPGHAFVGVYKSTASKPEFLVPIETTVLGNSTFESAVKLAQKDIADHEKEFQDASDMSYQIIDIRDARKLGVDPIQEAQAE